MLLRITMDDLIILAMLSDIQTAALKWMPDFKLLHENAFVTKQEYNL